MIGILISTAIAVTKTLAALTLAVEGVKMLCGAVMSLAKTLGLIKPEIQAEELGDKALQAEEAGIVPDDFDTYAEYVKSVEAFEVDPERSVQIGEEEKLWKGTELASGVMIEKFPDLPIEQFLLEMPKNPEFFTEARMEALGEQVKEDPELLAEVSGYLDGTEKDDLKLEHAITTLVEIEKKIDPMVSETDALRTVLDAGRMDK